MLPGPGGDRRSAASELAAGLVAASPVIISDGRAWLPLSFGETSRALRRETAATLPDADRRIDAAARRIVDLRLALDG